MSPSTAAGWSLGAQPRIQGEVVCLHSPRRHLIKKMQNICVSQVYEFLFAAVTSYYTFSGENSTKVFSYGSGGQKSKISLTGLSHGVGRASLPLRP